MSQLPMPPRQAAVVHATVAHLRADPGPSVEHYAVVLEQGAAVFKSSTDPDDVALADDGINVIAATGAGGVPAVWLRQSDLANDRGVDIGPGNQTIAVAGGYWRVLPAATLVANATWTLSPSGIVGFPELELTRLDTTSYTVAIVNGGVGGGTIVTLPASSRAMARVKWNGTNWTLRSSGLLL